MEQLLAIELEVTGKSFAAQEERKPVPVVRPHLVEGDGIERRPERDGFIRLVRLALEIGRKKYRAMQAEAAAN